MTFRRLQGFLTRKHNAKLSLTEVRIVLAALSAKVNFFPDVCGRREQNRQRIMSSPCASGWECQEQCGLKDWVLLGKNYLSWLI